MNTERGYMAARTRAALLGATGVLWALIATVALAGPAAAYGPGATPPTSVGSVVLPVPTQVQAVPTQVQAVTATRASGLAFTGADVAGLIAIAFVLIAIGLGIRAMGRRRQTS